MGKLGLVLADHVDSLDEMNELVDGLRPGGCRNSPEILIRILL